MNQPFRVFIGWDSREPIAFSVLAHSIWARTSLPVAITPLKLADLQRIYTRQRGPTESTEFSLSRFLVPHLSDYQGWSLFLDCDMLCRCDIAELYLYGVAHPDKAVHVCQHDYTPRSTVKFLNQPQTVYPRKNWSSAMLFNNELCTALTPEYVNTATGLELHRFNWIQDHQIGSLPLGFNWLIGEYPQNATAQIYHWTLGGPWLPETTTADHADLWFDELMSMTSQMAVTVG